jgi:hypothetical protein
MQCLIIVVTDYYSINVDVLDPMSRILEFSVQGVRVAGRATSVEVELWDCAGSPRCCVLPISIFI